MKVGDFVKYRWKAGKGVYKIQRICGGFVQIRRVTVSGEYSNARGYQFAEVGLALNFEVTEMPNTEIVSL